MPARHALLIGVPRCDDPGLTDIGHVVRADLRTMRQALEQSGYAEVETFGVEQGEEPTANRVRKRIRRACEAVPEGGVLLLYFSGHGISVDGADYLVPSDAERERGAAAPAVSELVPVVPADLERCRARLVVFFVDACRDDPARDHDPAVRGGMLPYLPDGDFVLVTGCRAGQRCHYGDTGSYFTQALAQTLDRRNPARTLRQVLDDVTRQMARRAGDSAEHRQEPQAHHPGTGLPGAAVEVCEGDELTVAWRRAVDATPLWGRCAAAPDDVAAARETVREIVARCAVRHNQAADQLKKRTGIDDPWTDRNHPVRVLARLPDLLADAAELTLPEAALLVAAPFLRERVIAEGVWQAAGIAPATFTRTYTPGARGDLELTHEMHQHLLQRAEGLAGRGMGQARDALAMWLVHQWLAGGSALWRGPAARAACAEGVRLLGGVPMPEQERHGLVETLVRAVGAGPAEPVPGDRPYLDGRWRALAWALRLAGLLAADVRRMPSVIADHVGTRLELPLETVASAVARLGWRRTEDTLDLHLVCDHPALHLALEEIAGRADAALAAARADRPLPDDLLKTLPKRATTAGLRPEQRDQAPVYATPVMTFRLAEEKVRELLMGRQLYDDPALAVRELYQNALDACRYRDTRLAYLRRTGEPCGGWTGRITVRQGVEDGRAYIECRDNGVGMDADTLLHVFANAGERFVYRQEYRAEQAAWEELNPPLRMVSNSQFGVGVFSYFMIADEITVVTRPVGRNGVPAPRAHQVHIASSGSLLQVTPSETGMPEGGTLVRLYLTGDEEVSALRTLRRLLWVAEYELGVAEDGLGEETWPAGELRQGDGALKCGDDLWWVPGSGGLLADGLRTNEEMSGLVVNLRGVHRPRFTVDRKRVRAWDKGWVDAEIERHLPELERWPGLTMAWLWQMTEETPRTAQRVFEHLRDRDLSLPIGLAWAQDTTVPVARVGCLPEDAEIFNPHEGHVALGYWVRAWRSRLWAEFDGSFLGRRSAGAKQGSAEGYPVAGPADAWPLGRIGLYRDRPLILDDMLGVLADPVESVAQRLAAVRRFAITGLDLSAARQVPPVTGLGSDDDSALLTALTTCTREGAGPRGDIAARLAWASMRLDLPLGAVLERVEHLAPPGWHAPRLELGALAGHVCTGAEAKLLSQDLDGQPLWISGEIPPHHVAAACVAQTASSKEVLGVYDRLSPLGVRVAGRERYPDDLDPFEIEALREISAVGMPVTALHMILVGARTGLSVREVHARMARLERQGLLRRADIAGLPDLVPDAQCAGDIEGFLMTRLDGGRKVLLLPPNAAARQLVCLIEAVGSPDTRRHKRLSTLLPFVRPEDPFTMTDLVYVAARCRITVEEARRRLLDAYPGAEVPPLSAGLPAAVPVHALTFLTEETAEASWEAGAGDIIAAAHDSGLSAGAYLELIRPLAAFGMPLPTPVADSLHDLHLEEEDVEMVTRHLPYETVYLGTVDALHLVRVAGRHGWTLAHTHERFRRFTPLGVTLDYPHDAVPDGVVHWQDLLALTVHLDGHAPAVTGAVTADHLAHAAAQLGETPDRVRDRLRRYAPLFALTVPQEETLG
ncbi:caspase family protein [Nonomuraea sp. SMC257]|uniref:Caspase family protein n=1 Tax=Nonomuraea montanisoli TaxID=2741721 RepID=A0A7Y6I971_9ACTN|nr:caspase family protein [Nonomuraea montanisoli]NUW34033.1 caspase family protein [Nonomuraea montanisoli]